MRKTAVIAASLLMMASSAFAQDSGKMQERLIKSFPNLGVESVEYVKEINLYELKIKNNPVIGYTNEANDFFMINGELINPKTKVNYTREREFTKTKSFMKSLPTEKAIVVKYGKGTRKMAVFTDPDCPFCKTLDKEIHTKLTKSDVTIYYYMNPLNIQGHEEAPLKAAKIWCSKDKSKAWVDWMINGKLPANDGSCKNPVAETKKFASEIGFNSTPRIIFDNGYTSDQAVTAEQIMTAFNAKKP
jgi:thiol:disulfide interchange protein DsbC